MHDTVDSAVIDEHEQAITTNWIDRSAELLGLVGSHIALLAAARQHAAACSSARCSAGSHARSAGISVSPCTPWR